MRPATTSMRCGVVPAPEGGRWTRGAAVSIDGLDGRVEAVDADGLVHVRMPDGGLVSGYWAEVADKSWPPSGIETKSR